MPENKQVSPNYSIKELWTRGKLYEIFGLMSGEFTALELAKEYSRLLKEVRSPEEEQILEDAFAVLNAPFTRQFYEGCRMVMGHIQREIGDAEYEEFEGKIWADLWGWVSQKWQPLPEELVRALIIKYGGAAKVAASSSRTSAPPPAPAQPRRIELERKRRKNWIIVASVLGSIAAIMLMVKACPSSPPPVLYVNTSPIYFSNPELGLLDADFRILTIGNTGGGKLTGKLTTNANWLWVSPIQIEIASGANQDIRIHVDTTGLPSELSDNCFVIIQTNGGEKQIPVSLTITSVIFEDDFSDPNSGWYSGQYVSAEYGSADTIGKAEYQGDGYRLLVEQAGYLIRGDNPKIGQLDDFVLEVDAQWHGTSSSYNYYGIVFREQDGDNKYVFYVSSDDGYYGLGKTVKGTASELKGWTESTYIKKGAAVNRLKVFCQGSQISVYVNNSLLTTLNDYSLSRGYVALMVGKGKSTYSLIVPDADAIFDNLKISAP